MPADDLGDRIRSRQPDRQGSLVQAVLVAKRSEDPRPVSEFAVMAPPMMIPAIGTRLGPFSGTAPLRKITVSTGTTPAASEIATQGHARRDPMRLEEVKTATANIRTANTADQARLPRTAVMITDTTAS